MARLKKHIRLSIAGSLFLMFQALLLQGQNIVEVGGLYAQNQLWTSDNEYHVVDNVRILLGTELRIEAGTIIRFNQGRGLYIEGGKLIVEGTSQDTVRMMANHSPGETWNWTGITISSVTQEGNVLIQYTHIRDALVGLKSVSGSELLIQNCHISNNRNIGISLFNSSYNTIQNNLISNNFLGMEIYASGPGNFSQYNEVVRNTFRNTTTNILIHNNNHGSCPHNNIEENLIDKGVHGIWLFNSTNQGGTGHVSINRNIIINNGTANDGYGIYVSMDSTTITHNIFWNNTNALNIIEARKTHFLNNSIYQNKRGITMRTNASDVGLINNTITASGEYVLRVNYADEALIAQNNIFNSQTDSAIIQNFSTQHLQLTDNFWGTTNDTLLENLFFSTAGGFTYHPVLPLPNSDAPISPPLEVGAQLVNGNVRLLWKQNPETDLLGYHVYKGEFKNYAFTQEAVFVTDTLVLLPAASINGLIAVTAVDFDGLQGGNPQLSGHESPFAFAKALPYAGEDIIVCENQFLISLNQSTLPAGFTNINWLSRGDGNFENANDLRTFYFPGEQDIQNGQLTLVLVADHDGNHFSDSLRVTFERQPQVFAGNRAIIQTDSLYNTSEASASNFNSLWWSSTGDGSFDNPDSLHTAYSPGPNDLVSGQVRLILQAFSAHCETISDTMLLTIKNAWSLEGRLWALQQKLAYNPVIAIKNEESNEMQSHFLTYTNEEGHFRFGSLFEGSYRLFAPLDTNMMESYLPTYYVNNSRWQEAYVLRLEGNTFDLDLHLTQKLSPLPLGYGSLQGHFSLDGFGRENSDTYCMPWFAASEQSFCDQGLSNVTVLLYGSSRERIYAHTLTDANGNFFFNNLPFGDYVIEVELAGYESAVSEVITLDQQRASFGNIRLQIEAGNKIGIYIPSPGEKSIEAQLYPNPAGDFVNISSRGFSAGSTLLAGIYSTDGRLLATHQLHNHGHWMQLNVTGLVPGLYLLKLSDGNSELVLRLGKR